MPETAVTSSNGELAALVEQINGGRNRLVISTDSGARAVLLSLEELEDLEDGAAVARYLMRQEAGTQTSVPHEVAMQRLRRRGP